MGINFKTKQAFHAAAHASNQKIADMHTGVVGVLAEIHQEQTQQQKPEQAQVHKPLLASTDEQLKVDEIIQIDQKLAEEEVLHMLERREELRKQLQSIANEKGEPHEEVTLVGTTGTVKFSKCTNKTEISDKNGLIQAMGPEVFMKLATVTATQAKKYLSEIELEKFVTVVPGSRTFKGSTPNPS